MQGGLEASLFQPLTHDGHLQVGEGQQPVYGCHVGPMQHLNVENAQPGYVYFYPNRTPSGVRKAGFQGWKVVGPEDPEHGMAAVDPNMRAAGLDGSHGLHDVVLTKMPESRYRLHREPIERENQLQTPDTGAELEAKNHSLEAAIHKYGERFGFFKAKDHGFGSTF